MHLQVVKMEQDLSKWLKEGEQTKITDVVKKHANLIQIMGSLDSYEFYEWGKSDLMVAANKTAKYISRSLRIHKGSNYHDYWLLRRDITQILTDGGTNSCNEYAHVFRGLMIAQGYPASYIEAVHAHSLFNSEPPFKGHAFCRIFSETNNVIIDPTTIKMEDNLSIYPYFIVGEGLDSWDLGFKKLSDFPRIREERLLDWAALWERQLDNKYKAEKKKSLIWSTKNRNNFCLKIF